MIIAKTKTIGSMFVAGQKFAQVHWLEVKEPENDNFFRGAGFLEIEKAEINKKYEKTIKDAIKKGEIPMFRGLPVKLAPKKTNFIEREIKTVEIPDDNPPKPEPAPAEIPAGIANTEKASSGAVRKSTPPEIED